MLETVKHLESEGFDVDIVSPDLTGRVSEEKILEKVKDNAIFIDCVTVQFASILCTSVTVKNGTPEHRVCFIGII